MLYFAYGSNLDPLQMRLRCPDARHVGKARLDGFRLCFPRRSVVRETAVAGLEPAAEAAVWGVLYEVDESDMGRLDEREGYDRRRAIADNPRNRATVTVVQADGVAVDAQTYVTTPSDDAGLPSEEYIFYLVRLAVACDLPAEYRETLEAMAAGRAAA